MTETPVLALEHVHHEVAGRTIVADLSLTVRSGECVAVTGPNGAGKTSLLRIAAGEVHPSRGRVLWNGTEAWRLPDWRLAAMRAVMSQSTAIGFSFPVADVVGLGFDGVGRRASPDLRRRAIARALEAADVFHLAARDVSTLSGGERQRVLFAKALAQLEAGSAEEQRRALLLDEPIASLDLSHQITLMQAVRRVADDGVAVVAVLHDLNLAAAFADRIVVVHDGRIAADGPPEATVTEAMLARVFGIVRRTATVGARAVPVVAPQFWEVPALRS
ncbi:heme ABC transporter ATP-binding protein [Methyloraptor flagellatus]|uniref:Heme ABC transporter ATP-binding protein n=1 Tax=Methyloraptor flagellatus TaxID=3162530 RepID=A0AAU7X926_9HYPH